MTTQTVICKDCATEFKHYRSNVKGNPKLYCDECLSKRHSKNVMRCIRKQELRGLENRLFCTIEEEK